MYFLLIAIALISVRGDTKQESKRVLNLSSRQWRILDNDSEVVRDLIVGGSLAGSEEYRSFAVTDPVINAGGLCGATLIYPDILISAAHCGLGGIFSNGVVMNIGATSIYGDDAIDRIEVADQLIHPDYDPISLSNDIMLIRLSSPSIAPASAWNSDPSIPENNEALTIIGHGVTESGGASETLQEATVFVVDGGVCTLAYDRSANSEINSDVVICAVDDVSSTCSGDSGGPLFRGSVLVGIVSFGIVSEFDGSCIADFPSGFTRISAFSNFISESICSLSASPPASCFASVDIPVAEPTEQPISRPPISPPVTSLVTSLPTLPPTLAPLQFSLSFTPVTPMPTSLSPSPFPSVKSSMSPSTRLSSGPSDNPAITQSDFPSADPSMIAIDALSSAPTTSAPISNAPTIEQTNAEKTKRSDENIGNTSSTVIAIEGDDRGFGTELQSSGSRMKNGAYSYIIMIVLVHGIALIQQ